MIGFIIYLRSVGSDPRWPALKSLVMYLSPWYILSPSTHLRPSWQNSSIPVSALTVNYAGLYVCECDAVWCTKQWKFGKGHG